MEMEGPKRMVNELEEMMEYKELPSVALIHPEKDNIFKWFALLLPTTPPYNKGSYNLEIDFPERYPFVPPLLRITTKAFHPNINERGQLCIPILEAEHWKPTSRMCTVLNVMMATLEDPVPENAFNDNVRMMYMRNRKQYDKIADAWVLRYAEERPTPGKLAKMKRKLKKAMEA